MYRSERALDRSEVVDPSEDSVSAAKWKVNKWYRRRLLLDVGCRSRPRSQEESRPFGDGQLGATSGLRNRENGLRRGRSGVVESMANS